MTTDNFCFYLQNRLIQTSQTGGQWYSDTSPFSIPWFNKPGTTSLSNVRLGWKCPPRQNTPADFAISKFRSEERFITLLSVHLLEPVQQLHRDPRPLPQGCPDLSPHLRRE